MLLQQLEQEEISEKNAERREKLEMELEKGKGKGKDKGKGKAGAKEKTKGKGKDNQGSKKEVCCILFLFFEVTEPSPFLQLLPLHRSKFKKKSDSFQISFTRLKRLSAI